MVDICTVSSILAIRNSAAMNILYKYFGEDTYDFLGVELPTPRVCICLDLLHID